jgi:hypothetical protein
MLDQTLEIGKFFPAKSILDWEKVTKEVLRTEDLNNKLLFKSVEGFDLFPLHINTDWVCELSSFPENVEIATSNIIESDNIINLTPIHNAGASIIQEIFYVCTQFIELLSKGTKNIEVHISLDSLFFTNIAKVRAIRYIFEKQLIIL